LHKHKFSLFICTSTHTHTTHKQYICSTHTHPLQADAKCYQAGFTAGQQVWVVDRKKEPKVGEDLAAPCAMTVFRGNITGKCSGEDDHWWVSRGRAGIYKYHDMLIRDTQVSATALAQNFWAKWQSSLPVVPSRKRQRVENTSQSALSVEPSRKKSRTTWSETEKKFLISQRCTGKTFRDICKSGVRPHTHTHTHTGMAHFTHTHTHTHKHTRTHVRYCTDNPTDMGSVSDIEPSQGECNYCCPPTHTHTTRHRQSTQHTHTHTHCHLHIYAPTTTQVV
jgi:hypothetical protein